MVTVIQEPPFVLTWYEKYSNTHEPVLVVGYDKTNQPVGFLPLSLSRKDGRLAHAGDWQGEYHGWICEQAVESDFLIQAMIALKNEFHPRQWTWRWMPPGAKIDWLRSKELARNGIFVKYISQRPPFLDLNNEKKIKKIMRNKSVRAKINRYKKRGHFYLERIKSLEKAAELFDVLAVQCDFRQEAIHGEAPFESDPNKKKFYVARMKYPQSNHFTVLWLNDEPIAYHFGACDESTVYLGLTGYNPVESRNSPGTILFVKLIELLRKEGYVRFDLTPGEDEYKARLGSGHYEVVEPTFYFNRKDKLLADAIELFRKTIKYLVLALRIDPKGVKTKAANLSDFLKRARVSPWPETFRQLRSRLSKREKQHFFKMDPKEFHKKDTADLEAVHTQRYSDFLRFRGSSPWHTRADILREALSHYSRGETSYTVVQNGILISYGWTGTVSQLKNLPIGKNILNSGINAEATIFYDFYVAPQTNAFEYFVQMLEKMLGDHWLSGGNPIYLVLSEREENLSKAIKKMGFEPLSPSIRPAAAESGIGKSGLVLDDERSRTLLKFRGLMKIQQNIRQQIRDLERPNEHGF